MKTKALFLPLLATLALSACGSDDRAGLGSDPLLPFPGAVKDPDDPALIAAMADLMKKTGGPANSRFEYSRIDLDGDGRRDALVYLKTPFGHWCGEYGCTMMVMKASEDDFSFVSKVAPIRPPLIVSNGGTNGWRDIIVRVDGRWTKQTKNVALKYDGHEYPLDPEDEPALPQRVAALQGVKVFP